jgi:hypothetical protein
MKALGRSASAPVTCYLTGGTTAVLLGWRASTVDVDVLLEPEQDDVLRAIPELKNELAINVELASPADFIPLPGGWRDRSPLVTKEGHLTFRHFDLISQTLAKLERGHRRDVEDVDAMLDGGLVDIAAIRRAFDLIEAELWRFPAVDPARFRERVDALSSEP